MGEGRTRSRCRRMRLAVSTVSTSCGRPRLPPRREKLLEPARVQPEEDTAVEKAEPLLRAEAAQRFLQDLQIAIDDWEFSVRVTRLRAAYAQPVTELAWRPSPHDGSGCRA